MYKLQPPLSPVGSRCQRRHAEYYLETGDIIFRVEETLFRVHKYFFLRESEEFRKGLPQPPLPGQKVRGASDDNPFPLDDVYSDDFARFLWVFYNPEYSFEGVTVQDWRSILMLAHRWQFPKIHALGIRELEKLDIGPVQKILIYHDYAGPEHLLVPSYTQLTLRDDPLRMEEGRALGLEVSLQIAKAREAARGQSDDAGLRSAGPVTLEDGDLEDLVMGVFNVTDASSTDSNSTTRRPKSSSRTVPTLNEVALPKGTSTNGGTGNSDSQPGPDGQNGDQKTAKNGNDGAKAQSKPSKKGNSRS
ncbi:hypothetical protein EWM64_g377 [Hericium alpestre]|uniref:BTB domain-containing protein n=1 Tax=Hericium alpestre TaxID=135208 RepID=A0A4Z0AA89_9AGAM|nr:hypothetical protein EWM64_g377 [Hericium alpestre]